MAFEVGETVGSYNLEMKLGRGGMATVFKAFHGALDRYVAIKVMHPAFSEDANFLTRFKREARVVAKLDHPNIVPIYDFSEHEGQPYLVMKYIEGQTLKERLAEGSIESDEVRKVLESVGDALTYAHSHGILHRDIKPSNVILSSDGRAYLTDFGLARIVQAGASTLSSDVMLGTPQYISPEQAKGEIELDERVDVYSLGVMLYEIMVGQVPFNADTPYSIVHDHIYTPAPEPRTISPNVPQAVEAVLIKALAKNREDRYRDVHALVSAFMMAINWDNQGSHQLPEPVGEEISETRDSDFVFAEQARVEPTISGSQTDTGGTHVVTEMLHEKHKASRRRWHWWYIFPILIALCVLVYVGGTAIRLNRTGGGSSANPGAGGPSQGTLGPKMAVAIAGAQQKVVENPADPNAYLSLAIIYWEAEDIQKAQQLFGQAREVAGDDSIFYHSAGDLLVEKRIWLPAAEMYLMWAELTDGRLSPNEMNKISSAVYLAASDEQAGKLVRNRERLRHFDPLFVETVKTRHQLHLGFLRAAGRAIDSILRKDPDYSPAKLLQAELEWKLGKRELAIELLAELSAPEVKPVWVVGIARAITEEFQLER